MATIRAYTTIEQSRKLAEILPLESADMKWYFWKNEIDAPKTPTFGYSKDAAESYKDTEAVYLPCWSLAELLGVLPGNYIDVNDTIYHPNLMKTKDGRYMIIYNVSQYTSLCNNPVDACYEMILKLHELNLL